MNADSDGDQGQAGRPKPQLSLFDSTSMIVGIIIGAGIYKTAPDVAGCAPAVWGVLAFWIAGGALSLCGALCYAELAVAYPRQGGDYVYLNRAYGSWAGFLFAWAQLSVIRPGTVASMALVFGDYAQRFAEGAGYSFAAWPAHPSPGLLAAAASVAFLTGLNVLGVKHGKHTQNILTAAKALGLLFILAAAVLGTSSADSASSAAVASSAAAPTGWNAQLAMILVLFAYGGWNEMAFVAAEVQDPSRNIVRALVLGTTAVTVLYVLVNAAFLFALGHAGTAGSQAVAADAVASALPNSAAQLVNVLVCVSALGAVNGMIFTGARISYALGAEHRPFRWLGVWNRRFGTPSTSLVVQGAASLAILLAVGTFAGTVVYTTAVVWAFFLMTGVALFVLRRKDPDLARPFLTPWHPFTTLLFCGSCLFLIYSGLTYSPPDFPRLGLYGSLVALCIVLAGLPIFWWSKKLGPPT